MGLVLISELSKLSLVTAIMVLTLVSCYYMTSFNYGGKKARDVDVTCKCHLSNIIPDSIGDNLSGVFLHYFVFVFFKKRGDNHYLPQHKRDGFSCLIIITPMGLGKP